MRIWSAGDHLSVDCMIVRQRLSILALQCLVNEAHLLECRDRYGRACLRGGSGCEWSVTSAIEL